MHLHLQQLAVQPVQGGTSSSRRLLAGGDLPQSLYGQAWPLQSFPAEVHKLSRVSLSLVLHNSHTFEGVARSPKVARDATTSAPGEMGRLDGTITELTKLLLSSLSIFLLASSICISLSRNSGIFNLATRL